MKRYTILNIFLLIQLFILGSLVLSFVTTQNSCFQDKYACGTKPFGNYNSFPSIKVSANNYKNATVISDGYLGKYWNSGECEYSSIAVDNSGNIHVIWEDTTEGIWGGGYSDYEIMYAKYLVSTGQWSNATVISDGYQGSYWNTGGSYSPSIAVDNLGNLHVVWQDDTPGKWGTGAGDNEIMYVKYSVATGQWSNITVISDGYQGSYWNDGYSYNPSIAIDSSRNLHVVWEDHTLGKWNPGTEPEIMYANFSVVTGQWSNITLISDGYQGVYWNTGFSWSPTIAVDNLNNLYVVWDDNMVGKWGGGPGDIEIMFANYSVVTGQWSNATVISDGYKEKYWNTGDSYSSSIEVDSSGNLYVAWNDNTPGKWKTGVNDYFEIMFANYSVVTGQWSNVTVISDGYKGIYWNTGNSFKPSIAADNFGNLYVVWEDLTDGKWGVDTEIMYIKYSIAEHSWSNVTVISDGYQEIYWNTGSSEIPSITIDTSGNLHIIWRDDSPGIWRYDGSDFEIMYTKITLSDNNVPTLSDDDDDDGGDNDEGSNLLWIIILIVAIFSIIALVAIIFFLKKK